MSKVDLEQLEKLAEEVLEHIQTPWVWPSKNNGEYSVECKNPGDSFGPTTICTPNSNFPWSILVAKYIATAQPSSVLALIAEVRAEQDRADKAEKLNPSKVNWDKWNEDSVDALRTENAALRKVLEFYANDNNWTNAYEGGPIAVWEDDGERARQALAGEGEKR